jgi:hypothetical protein
MFTGSMRPHWTNQRISQKYQNSVNGRIGLKSWSFGQSKVPIWIYCYSIRCLQSWKTFYLYWAAWELTRKRMPLGSEWCWYPITLSSPFYQHWFLSAWHWQSRRFSAHLIGQCIFLRECQEFWCISEHLLDSLWATSTSLWIFTFSVWWLLW